MSLRTKLSKPKKRKRRELIWILSITCLLVVWYSIEIINAEMDDVTLKRYWIVTQGELYDVKLRGKSASSTYYSYEVNGKGYIGEYFHETRNVKKHFKKLKKIDWYVIYDSTDHSNSALLLRREDFEEFGVPYSGQRVVDFESFVN